MAESVERSKMVFVGRKAELRQLNLFLKKAINSQNPKFFLIEGDFGVGKTALVEYFLEHIKDNNKQIIVGKCKCSMETEKSGLAPFIQLLESIGSNKNKRIFTGKFVNFIKEIAPAWVDVFTNGVYSATTKTVLEGQKFLGYHSFSQENIFVQFNNAIARIAQKHTLICFIDDLHWADTSSLSLLFHLSRNLSGKALFICTYRPVDVSLGLNSSLWAEISANLIRNGAYRLELTQGINVIDYIAKRYPSNNISKNLVDRIQNLTNGHVLFVSELFSLWEHKGLIVTKINAEYILSWELSETTDMPVEIPQAVDEVLKQRIQLIESGLREMLVCGSVVGEEFTAQIIKKVCELDEIQLFDDLEALEHRYRIIKELGHKELPSIILDFYQFAHPFYREHIYSHMSMAKKRILHRYVGEALETLYQDDIFPVSGQLTLHFRQANNMEKAAKYALMAVKYEQSRSAWTEGEQWCEEGLEIVNSLQKGPDTELLRLKFLEQSGFGFISVSKFSDAEERYKEALEIATHHVVDGNDLANIYYMLSNISRYNGQPDQAKRNVGIARDILVQYAVPFSKIHLDLAIIEAIFHIKHGDPKDAIPLLTEIMKEAIKLPQTSILEFTKAEIYNSLGMAFEYLGKYHQSLISFQEAYSIAKKIQNPSLESTFILNIADDYFLLGELEKSLKYVSDGFLLAQRTGNLDNEAYARTIKGTVLIELGRYNEAVHELTEALSISKHVGSEWNMPYIYSNLAKAQIALLNITSAYRMARLGVINAHKIGFEVSYALDVLGQVEYSRKNYEAALIIFKRAIVLARKTGRNHYLARAQLHLAQVFLEQNEKSKGISVLKLAIENFNQMEAKNELRIAQHLLATHVSQ